LKTFLDGCSKGELREWREESCNSWIFWTRYEGKVEMRAVCGNRRRVVNYDAMTRTTRVKEEDEAL